MGRNSCYIFGKRNLVVSVKKYTYPPLASGSCWLELTGMWAFGRKSTQGKNQVFAGELVYAGGSPGRILLWEWNDQAYKVMKIRFSVSEG